MGISSVGVGSSILTQDVLDQLQKADEAAMITPLTLSIANEKDKQAAFDTLDANMTNLIDSINEIKNATLFDERQATVNGTSVEITADANSDVQEFTMDVQRLATKEIVESGSFASSSDKIASDSGYMEITVGTASAIRVDYTADMTLDELKKAINDAAGDYVTASLVNIGSGDTRLFLTAKNSGDLDGDNTYDSNGDLQSDDPDISISDVSGNLSDDGGATSGGTKLTTGLVGVQTGEDAAFTYNGQSVTRSSNTFDDLVAGYNITLKELGSSTVSVTQNRDAILEKIDSFVEKYNAAMSELGRLTKPSTDSKERGIFSNESAIKSIKSALRNMMDNVGGGVGTLYDYGFDIDKNGKLSVDKDVINKKLDEDPKNVEAFFSGGDFTDASGTVTNVQGAFGELYDIVDSYTSYNGMLNDFDTALSERLSELEESKSKATERLDAKYETLKKQFIAYDAMIAKLNNASSMFIQLANAQTASQNN